VSFIIKENIDYVIIENEMSGEIIAEITCEDIISATGYVIRIKENDN
jgi:hypothetical protein